MDLSTKYLGLELKNPIIIGASNLVTNLETMKKLEAAGAAAIVYKSLFEEQIHLENLEMDQTMSGIDERHAEMASGFNDTFDSGPEDFLLQFNIFTQNSSASQAGTLLESLKTMFDDCSLAVTGWRHLQFQRGNVYPNNDFSQIPPVQGYSVEYNVLLEKAR